MIIANDGPSRDGQNIFLTAAQLRDLLAVIRREDLASGQIRHTRSMPCRPLLRGVLVGPHVWRDEPLLPGWQRATTTLAVLCPWCDVWHHHEWAPEHDGRWCEHRGAHCIAADSPYRQPGPDGRCGYWVSVVRGTDHGYDAHVVRPGQLLLRRAPLALAARAAKGGAG